jgi:hypothetical protein
MARTRGRNPAAGNKLFFVYIEQVEKQSKNNGSGNNSDKTEREEPSQNAKHYYQNG